VFEELEAVMAMAKVEAVSAVMVAAAVN